MSFIAAAVGAAGGAAAVDTGIAGVLRHRQCAVTIKNNCSQHTLCNPSWHATSGFCAIPLSPSVERTTTENALFIKTPHGARGSVGVFTYDLQNTSTQKCTEKIAVMFSVPYDFNLYSNWYAVGIFEERMQCDYDLYYKMYNKEGREFVRGKASGPSLIYKSHHVTVMATMSDSYQPVMKVEVSDK